MSGLEGPALAAGGGRLLGGLAVPAGRALARKMTFRWSVWWRVRKRVDFSCRGRAYREWLKTITAGELARPVEDIQGPLAKRLDEAMSSASVEWTCADDHLSRALRLVELTYPAIAAALGDDARAELSESWAQRRSVIVRDVLLQTVGPGAALSPEDFAMVLLRRSRARRAVRLQAFDIDEAALASYFDRIEVLDVSPGGVALLLGDFGSGKSETAEAWHRAEIRNFMAADQAPFPVWLSARGLLGQTLESAVEHELGPAWRHGRGASIALDGLDETEPATAQTLLAAARTLAMTYQNVRVLVTARPGILSPTKAEEVTAALLPEDEALELVASAGGNSRATWRWTADMRATVTRPFFALAAGVMLGRNQAPQGEADLIRGLVEDALANGTERSAVTSRETRSVLENLAVALTRTGAEGLAYSDRQIARSSRLVSDGPDGSVRFSLPIFQHWFAAQSILRGTVPAAEIVDDAPSFNRWRWAAAVAALSAQGAEAVDALLGAWVSRNPGAAAWILDAAFGGHRDWRTDDDQDLNAKTSGTRLLRALRTWTDALGPLADGVLPFPMVRGPVELGVTASGHRIDVAFSTSRPAADHVTEVPLGVHPLSPVAAPDWLPWISGGAPQGEAWPWTMVQRRIANATLKRLSNDPLLGAPDGVWVQERRFDLARRLLSRGSLFHGNLAAGEVRRRATERFGALGRDRDARISFGGGSPPYSGGELEDLVSWIDATAPDWVTSNLPVEDVPQPRSGWVWDLFSPQRLMEFEVEVYGRACEAYDEAIAHSFARLGWSMPNSALSPFGVLLELRHEGADQGGLPPGLIAMLVPMALITRLAPHGPDTTWSASKRAAITTTETMTTWEHNSATLETVSCWLTEQNREPIGGLGWTHTGADDMSNARPASSVAAQWLWNDLKSLGLGSGTFPQLR